jgi:hypothetical protein
VENNGLDRVIPCERSANVTIGLFGVVVDTVVDIGAATLASGSISSSEAN